MNTGKQFHEDQFDVTLLSELDADGEGAQEWAKETTKPSRTFGKICN